MSHGSLLCHRALQRLVISVCMHEQSMNHTSLNGRCYIKSFIAQDTLANTMSHLLCCGLTRAEETLMQKKQPALSIKATVITW